ncbi:hypothetical protein BgiBS90_002871, partial [Biomphalaria glabrata]
FSKLDLPSSRFRWLVYPTSMDQIHNLCVLYPDICDKIQPVLMFQKNPTKIPFSSMREKISGFVANAVMYFTSLYENDDIKRSRDTNTTTSEPDVMTCSQNCSYLCKACQDLFQMAIRK